MRSWRTHTDLWILSTLLAALFAFQQGDRVLAAVGPRLAVLSNNVTSRLASFAAVPTFGSGVNEAVPVESHAAEAQGLRAAPQRTPEIAIAPTVRRVPENVERRQFPRVVLRPNFHEPCDHGCSW